MTDMFERIAKLCEAAHHECVDFSEKTLQTFQIFMRLTGASRPWLYLLNDGSLEAAWRNAHQRAAIKFNGDTISWRLRNVREIEP